MRAEKMKSPLFKQLGQWGMALVLIILLFVLGDVSELVYQTEIAWGFAFLGFLSGLGFTFAHNFRWKEIVNNLSGERRIRFFPLYRSLINSYALGKIIPMDMSLLTVRSYYLRHSQNMPITQALFSVLMDRFLDFLLFVIMALPSFLFISKMVSTLGVLLVVLLFLLLQGWVILWKKGETFSYVLKGYRALMIQWVSKIPLLGTRVTEGARAEGEIGTFPLNSLFRILIWNYLKYIFLCLRFYFTGLTFGVSFPLINAFFYPPFIQFSMLINITPGGLGVVEMGTYGALLLMGISKPQILIFVVGQRILLFAIFLAIFILSHLIFFIQSRLNLFER